MFDLLVLCKSSHSLLVYFPDGAVVVVPAGSVVIAPRQKYVLDNEGHPVADHKGRSITVDNDTIILQVCLHYVILLL